MISVPTDYSVSSDRIQTDAGRYSIVESAIAANNEIPLATELFWSGEATQPMLSTVKSNDNQREVSEPTEWTSKLEKKFNRLAERKSILKLTLAENIEFEKLAACRRQLKNPRTGEEVIAEYEQRVITRNLVEVLAQYVNWHKQFSSNNSR